ncbi:MAG: hypothetical protein KAS38_07365 [Anaerolineales bacterium]|nr:hypothetical protein [Anaerolineales bacterium]
MKRQLELPMLTIVSKDTATIWNSNIRRKRRDASYERANRVGFAAVAELRGNHGSSYVRIYDKRGVILSFPVQMCLDLFTPKTPKIGLEQE